jgi:hypothetical protein
MTFILPKSVQFLNSFLPNNTIGIGITTLPKRNIIQSISDYFAEKSGNKRISFVILSDAEIKILHFRGNSMISKLDLSLDQLININTSSSTSEDGIISILNCQLDEIISTDKKGKHKKKSHSITILPCYYGMNLTQFSSTEEIIWANENKEKISQFLGEKSKKESNN